MRLLALLILSLSSAALPSAGAVPEYNVKVVHSFPHDRTAFTQGFEYHGGRLYEGTGLEGRSSVRIEDLVTGSVLRQVDLPSSLFGEGITVMHDTLIEITWQSHIGFTYHLPNLAKTNEFHYVGEGWGLTNNGKQIYFSDGTADIRVLNATTLRESRRIHVHEGDKPIVMLNELEWIEGEIWANIWQTDRIARISPRDGRVLGWVNAGGLLTSLDLNGPPVDVLNGIAYDAVRKRIFLTGKLWPKVFEVKIVPR